MSYRWGCACMDPPWAERGGGKIKRGADRHYGLVETPGMPAVLMGSGLWTPVPNAHLWTWATVNHLPDALWLIDQMGFRYVSAVAWVKTADPERIPATFEGREGDALRLQIGLGQYLRGAFELLLFAVRKGGRGQAPDVWGGHRDVPSVVRARRGRHSAKPDEAFAMIERVSVHPVKLELFARAPRPGWKTWGNEAPEGDAR